MNKHDKANFDFLMSTDAESLKQWFISATKDDVAYAVELLSAASMEMSLNQMELYSSPEDLTLANSVLSKFRL